MKIHGIEIAEGSDVENLTVAAGTDFPSNENMGELFYRSDSDELYLNNGSSWNYVPDQNYVDTRDNYLRGQNLIINGSFDVWQRGSSFTLDSSLQYTADRWFAHLASGMTGTMDADIIGTASIPTSPTRSYYIELTVTGEQSSLSAAHFTQLGQAVEGYRMKHLLYGDSDAKTMTLSFWHAHTTTGTYSIAIRNSLSETSYVAEYTQSSSDTWEYESITIPGEDGSGSPQASWGWRGGIGMYVTFTLAAGSNLVTPITEEWILGNRIASTSQVNIFGNNGAKFRVTDVQVEVGDQATNFDRRGFNEEFLLCQRYYQTSYSYGVTAGTVTLNGARRKRKAAVNTNSIDQDPRFFIPMRTSPTVTLYSPVSGNSGNVYDYTNVTDQASLLSLVNDKGFTVLLSSPLTGEAFLAFQYTADAEL